MSGQVFGLRVRLEVYPAEVGPNGMPYRSNNYGVNGGLELNEELLLGATGFMEIAAVLRQFYELAQTLQRAGLPAVPAAAAPPLDDVVDLPDLRDFPLRWENGGFLWCGYNGPCDGNFDLPGDHTTVRQVLVAIAAHRRQYHFEPAMTG